MFPRYWLKNAIRIHLPEMFQNVNFKIRELNSAIRTSPQRFELLESSCNACQIQYRKPILDCPTQWNSTYDMIVNGLSLKPVSLLFLISHSLNTTSDGKFIGT